MCMYKLKQYACTVPLLYVRKFCDVTFREHEMLMRNGQAIKLLLRELDSSCGIVFHASGLPSNSVTGAAPPCCGFLIARHQVRMYMYSTYRRFLGIDTFTQSRISLPYLSSLIDVNATASQVHMYIVLTIVSGHWTISERESTVRSVSHVDGKERVDRREKLPLAQRRSALMTIFPTEERCSVFFPGISSISGRYPLHTEGVTAFREHECEMALHLHTVHVHLYMYMYYKCVIER